MKKDGDLKKRFVLVSGARWNQLFPSRTESWNASALTIIYWQRYVKIGRGQDKAFFLFFTLFVWNSIFNLSSITVELLFEKNEWVWYILHYAFSTDSENQTVHLGPQIPPNYEIEAFDRTAKSVERAREIRDYASLALLDDETELAQSINSFVQKLKQASTIILMVGFHDSCAPQLPSREMSPSKRYNIYLSLPSENGNKSCVDRISHVLTYLADLGVSLAKVQVVIVQTESNSSADELNFEEWARTLSVSVQHASQQGLNGYSINLPAGGLIIDPIGDAKRLLLKGTPRLEYKDKEEIGPTIGVLRVGNGTALILPHSLILPQTFGKESLNQVREAVADTSAEVAASLQLLLADNIQIPNANPQGLVVVCDTAEQTVESQGVVTQFFYDHPTPHLLKRILFVTIDTEQREIWNY